MSSAVWVCVWECVSALFSDLSASHDLRVLGFFFFFEVPQTTADCTAQRSQTYGWTYRRVSAWRGGVGVGVMSGYDRVGVVPVFMSVCTVK